MNALRASILLYRYGPFYIANWFFLMNGMSFYSYCPAHRAVYAAGFLHQDLSPGNIIIVDGRGYLIDWDFTKATKNDAPHRITCIVC